jgi:hypothetical protein
MGNKDVELSIRSTSIASPEADAAPDHDAVAAQPQLVDLFCRVAGAAW